MEQHHTTRENRGVLSRSVCQWPPKLQNRRCDAWTYDSSDEALERRLTASAFRRGGWLAVERVDGYGWRSAIRVPASATDLIPDGIILLGVEGCESRRQALEQLEFAQELEAEHDSWRPRS